MNKIIKLMLVFCVQLFLFDTVRASSLNLSEILKIASERNPDLKIQDNEVKARENLAEAAGAWKNPEFSIEIERKEDSASNSTNSTKFGLSQSFSAFGKFSEKAEAARAAAKIEKINLSQLELKIKIDVTALTFEYAADIEKARHVEERLKRFQSVYVYIRSRTFASPQKQTEASIVSSKLLVLQKELIKAKSEVDLTWNRLNYYLGIKDKANVKINWIKKEVLLSEASVFEKAQKQNPELLKLNFELQKNEAEKSFARKDTWSEFTISGSISNGSGFAPEKTSSLGLSLPLPVFSKNSLLAEAQTYRAQASQIKLDYYRSNLEKFVNSSVIKFKTAQSAVLNFPVSKASEIEKDFAKSDLGFKKGLVDLVSYLEADAQHFDAITVIYDTQTEFVQALGEITLLTGEFLIPVEQ